VLVTGASGFVGSHIARLLVREGLEVHAIVRERSSLTRVADIADELRLVHADLLDTGEVERHVVRLEPELCIHAAWYAVPGKYLDADENAPLVAATAALGSALARAGCSRLVGVGTCYEYDTRVGTLSESAPTRPLSVYAASKFAAFLLLEQVGARAGMDVAWTRLFYQYGPFEDERRLVPAVISVLLQGQEARVTRGEQIRDFLHVEDVAAAVWAVARSGVTGAVNVGSGEPITVRGLVEMIGSIVGRPDLLAFGALPDRPDDPPVVCADNRRLVVECAWRRTRTHAEGLRETVEWWRSHSALPAAIR
jgi:nucleoside-diphosphate-sugar epimerase